MSEDIPVVETRGRNRIATLTDERDRARVDLAEEKAEGIRILERMTTKDEFLAVVSHDLRAPLSVISMSADELLELVDCAPARELRIELIEMVRRNAATMERLISDLLDVERMSSNKLELRLVHEDLNVLARDSVENFRAIGIAKGIGIELRLSPVPLMAELDVDRIGQVFSNLLSNAIKFTPSNGAIVVATYREGARLVVCVQDSGPGIAEEQRTHIFERNSQIGRDRHGLGLGLYISNWLVTAHAGRIWVENKAETGSQFYFELPALS